MPFDTHLLLIGILLAMQWTPGPNNALLAASGAQFGWRPTLPHLLGVALGFSLMLFIIALGLAQVFKQSVMLREGLRWLGAGLMVYFSYLIATAPPPGQGNGRRRPFRLYEAMAFQWINPKAWVMAISLVSQFTTGIAPLRESGLIAITAALCGLTSAAGWAGFGVIMQRWLHTPLRHRAFNVTMGLIILSGAVALVFSRF